MRQSLRAVTVVLLVALAGCGAVPTPGPDTPTTTSPEYPPGVTEDGLDDADTLLDAHRESVLERGAVVVSTSTIERRVNGEIRSFDLSGTARAGPDAGPVYYETERVRVSGDGDVVDVRVAGYADREGVTERFVTDGNASIEREPRDLLGPLRDRYVAREWELQRALSADEFAVAAVERRGGEWVTTLVANEGSVADDEGQFSTSIEVSETGRVQSLTLTRTPGSAGGVGREELRVTWSDGTTVEAPEWAQ